jgi:hypothetical protein
MAEYVSTRGSSVQETSPVRPPSPPLDVSAALLPPDAGDPEQLAEAPAANAKPNNPTLKFSRFI